MGYELLLIVKRVGRGNGVTATALVRLGCGFI